MRLIFDFFDVGAHGDRGRYRFDLFRLLDEFPEQRSGRGPKRHSRLREWLEHGHLQRIRGCFPAAVQLLEATKLQSGSKEPNRNKVGKVTWAQVEAIAKDKMPDLNCFTVESAMRMVAGTARSMGITVEGAAPWAI